MKILFKNGQVILPRELASGLDVLVEDGKITKIAGNLSETDAETVDLKGKYLAPGFIDMHVHGGGGYDFMDGTEEAVKGAALCHLRHGTTTICPTTLTCLNEELFAFFDLYRKVKAEWTDGPNFAGIHLEGPFVSPAQGGAQDPSYLQLPVPENYMPMLEKGGRDIIRISLAPELKGGMELGRELKKRGIIASIGHSDANFDQCREAVEAGYSMITHFYSCCSTIHREGPYRVLGIVEAGYLMDTLLVETIGDGIHLPADLLKMIVKFKGVENISLITDANRGADMPDGSHVLLGSLAHGQDCIVHNGVAIMPDFKCFAGSICTTDRCVRTMVQQAGVSLVDAVRMMTENPAKVLGLFEKGSLKEGFDADLVVFDEDIRVHAVYVGGEKRA